MPNSLTDANAVEPRSEEHAHIEQIRAHLRAARKLGRRRQLRVKMPPMLFGAACLIVGNVAVALLMKGAAFRLAVIEMTLIGLVTFLLSVLPTERRTVAAFGMVTLALHVAYATIVLLYVVLRVEHGDQKTPNTQDARRDTPFFAFAAGTHLGVEHWCLSAEAWVATRTECAIRTVQLASGIVQVTGWMLGAAHVALSLARFAHGRPRLDALFFSLGCNCVVFGTAYTTVFVAAAALGGRGSYPTPPVSLVGHAVIVAVGVLSLRPSLRAALVGWLAARGEAGSSAIAISTLMGAGSTDEVLARSRELLCAVSAEQLRASDFATAFIPADAAARTRRAYAGEIDAFVSHSWQGDPAAKWAALVAWCDDFKRLHGRWPLLWIDRFCVSSRDASMSVACLPVFVSACNTLLVLFDETFLSRLWCVVELWCFLAMGGDPQCVDVRDTRRGANASRELPERSIGAQTAECAELGVSAHRAAPAAAPQIVAPEPSACVRAASRAATSWLATTALVKQRVIARLPSAAVGAARASLRSLHGSRASRTPSGGESSSDEACEMPSIEALVARFHARDAVCTVSGDHDRLLDLVETYPGGLARFHSEIRAMLLRCDHAAPCRAARGAVGVSHDRAALLGLGHARRWTSRVAPISHRPEPYLSKP